MPSVESLLTRELDLRFIDARTIATEARVALGIEGYPNKDKGNEIRVHAIQIFQNKDENEREEMRRKNWELAALKSSMSEARGFDSQSIRSDTSSSESSARRREGSVFGFLRRR